MLCATMESSIGRGRRGTTCSLDGRHLPLLPAPTTCVLTLASLSPSSPSLVANLWDVTDKDIDRLSEQVFRDLGVGADSKDPVPVTKGKSKQVKEVKTKSKAKAVEETTPMGGKATTTAQAVGRARNSCKLPYLTGAAVVVYGVPVRL